MAQGNINQNHYGSGDNVAGDKTNIHQHGNFGVGVNQGEISGNAKIGGVIDEAQQPNLSEAISEVQNILAQLSQIYPNNIDLQAEKTIRQIENRPSLKQKLISAGKQAGIKALEKAFDNPAGAIITGAIGGWIDA